MTTPQLPHGKRRLISLVGRPNVGKSSLFNALVGQRKALVLDFEGVTRDRRFGIATPDALQGASVEVCDTGGWMPEAWRKARVDKEMLQNIEIQIHKALAESALVVVVMDAREGPTALDREIVNFIRRLNQPFMIAANKSDQMNETYQTSEFYSLGADDIAPVSAEHKLGIYDFWEKVRPFLPEENLAVAKGDEPLMIAIVGRPNVGKSSLLNRFVGEDRSVASALPGTTTDPVDVTIERAGRSFILIDTAGIRRHAKRENDVEDLGVLLAERSLDRADLAFLVIDAEQGVTTQDSRIARIVEEAGCACVVLANKWDNAPHNIKSDSAEGIKKFREIVEAEWPFLDFAPLVALSAERGKIYGAVEGADALEPEGPWPMPHTFDDLWQFSADIVKYREKKVSPKELREVVDEAFAVGPNWVASLGEFRKLHQVGNRPPQFLAYVLDANKVPEALRRYLKRSVRERFGFRGNPIRWVFRHKRDK